MIDEKTESRYKYMQDITKHIKTSKDSIDFIYKKHLYGKNILDDCKYILSNDNSFLYDIDGLIFTPKNLRVF